MPSIGEKIRAFRTQKKLTQEAFGELLSVTAVTVSRWERGKDEPNIGIKRRLEVLVSPNVTADFAIKALVQGYGGIAVLADAHWRVVKASPLFLALNRLSELEVFGRDYSKFWPSEMDPFMKLFRPNGSLDGQATHEVDGVFCRPPNDRANNDRPHFGRGRVMLITEGVSQPYVLFLFDITHVADETPKERSARLASVIVRSVTENADR